MKILVTGGSGFLGEALVRRLVARGDEVTSLSRRPSESLAALGVLQVSADLGDASGVLRAAKGCDAVIHTAAKAGVWGDYAEYHRINVVGTRHVLDACRAHAVPILIHTSSPSVAFDGRDQEGVDERAPYPTRYLAAYPETKAEAEKLVLRANCGELATVALRPHLIWGPGDPHLVPRVLALAARKKLLLIGRKDKLVDAVYIDNAASAHVAALERLRSDPSGISGKAYYVTNHEPWPMAKLLSSIAIAGGEAPPMRRVPRALAFVAGWALENTARLGRKKTEPDLTLFVAKQLATAHWYDNTAAKTQLGYVPEISMDEGIRRLKAHLEARRWPDQKKLQEQRTPPH